MEAVKSLVEWMRQRSSSRAQLLEATGLDSKVLDAILQGRYTPSPQQRCRVAAALAVDPAQIVWGHTAPVEHIHGHGPQFGRSP